MTFDWYARVSADKPLSQGDIILGCPVAALKDGPYDFSAADAYAGLNKLHEIRAEDIIIVSQACDLEHNKLQEVAVCSHRALSEYKSDWKAAQEKRGQKSNADVWKRHCEDIRKGFVWNLAMIDECPDDALKMSHRIVNFHEIFMLPRALIEAFVKAKGNERLRLLPPYREHLSQGFARFFMRVGLPNDIKRNW